VLVVVLIAASGLGLLALYGWIAWDVRRTADKAVAEFGGDRVSALTELVECQDCGLRERNLAVWSLGQLGDRRGLAVLKKYHTQSPCNHAVDLCQYELGKAIKKMEGTWNLSASLHYEGTAPTSP
jgi:HEAT repeat protein